MTDQERKVMEMALEALEGIHVGNMTPMAEENWNKALTALRTALAQPEQMSEPIYLSGQYVGEGKVVSIKTGLPDGAIQEACHMAKLAQPEQEPVAWMYVNKDGEVGDIGYGVPTVKDPYIELLYTAPPSKQDVNQELVEALNTILWTRAPNKNPSRYAHTVEEIAFRALAKHDKLKEQP